MIRYADGREARVGDHVDCDEEPSIVEELGEGDHPLITSGVVDGPGLMFTNKTFGRLFVPADSPDSDRVILLRRA